jgi:hypothetical protein
MKLFNGVKNEIFLLHRFQTIKIAFSLKHINFEFKLLEVFN